MARISPALVVGCVVDNLASRVVGGVVGGFVGRVVVGAAAIAVVAGCPTTNKIAPDDKPVFPTGLAIANGGDHLLVVSSNFDLRFNNGAVLVADLQQARRQLDGPDAVVVDAYLAGSTVGLPSLGDRPVLDASGQHLFVTTRGENLLHEIEVDGDGGLSCGDAELCSEPPFALQLGANDPFDVVLFTPDPSDEAGAVRGLITHLSSNQAEIFTLDPAAKGAERLRVEGDVVLFGEGVGGVRSAVLRPGGDNNDEQVFVTLQRIDEAGILAGTSLAVFAAPGVGRGDDVVFSAIDVTGVVGSLTARGIALVPDPSGGEGAVAVVAALRSPDALARFAWDDASGFFALTAVTETCDGPTHLAFVGGAADDALGGVDRLLLSCQDGEVVQAIDPLTLRVQDSLRFFGRNPYAIAVDAVHGQAFVSFFLDDTVGVLDLVDDDGRPTLAAIGRIGQPLPPPQDGRE